MTRTQEGVAIELTPLGSKRLLGMPAAELWDRSSEFADVVGSPGVDLWERLQHANGWPQRFDVCDDVLSQLAGPSQVVPELQCCWETLVTSGGRIPVSELAGRTGYSRQHLGRLFREELPFFQDDPVLEGALFGA